MSPEHLEDLVQQVRSLPDPKARDAALALVQAVMDLHAEGLERSMEIVAGAETGEAALEGFANEPHVSAMLLLHNLHPHDLEKRVRRGLAMGSNAELVSIREGIVHVRVQGGTQAEDAVRRELAECAPDAAEVVVEHAGNPASNGFVPLTELLVR